jgi:hypothetical protein
MLSEHPEREFPIQPKKHLLAEQLSQVGLSTPLPREQF